MNNNDWIPVSSGNFPPDNKSVQVTFLGWPDKEPYYGGTAYRIKGTWCWALTEEECGVAITAWKPCGEPYHEIEKED